MNTGPWRSLQSINIMLTGSSTYLNQILIDIQGELAEQAYEKCIELFRFRTADFLINDPRLESKISELTAGQKDSLDELLLGYGQSIGCVIELDAVVVGRPNELQYVIRVSEPVEDVLPGGDDDSDLKVDVPLGDTEHPMVMTAHA